jgi:hydroxymethylpyrimidine/phosphomethylpyrimidine kinase
MESSGASRSVGKARERIAVATVAGSDPTGGAGLQRDLRTFEAHGVRGTAVVTAVTVQGRAGVRRVEPLGADLVEEQLEVVLDEVRPVAIKTGMLWDGSVVAAVARAMAVRPEVLLVVDPVLAASAGGALLRPDALEALRERLLPRARLVTPNLPEAASLLGVSRIPDDQVEDAARRILSFGCEAVLLKGGHGEGPEAVDVLVTREGTTRFSLPRRRGVDPHGTGCALSAAIVANLALGRTLPEACREAKRFVHETVLGGGPPSPPPTPAQRGPVGSPP